MPDLRFRHATTADAPLLAKMNQQLQIDEEHRLQMELTELEPRMRQWLGPDGNGYEAVIFSHSEEPVGYALYRSEERHIYLKQFYVGREVRRQGIGRAAIEWLFEHVWQDEPAVYLDVLVNNRRAIAFWQSVGFRDYCITMERMVESAEPSDGDSTDPSIH